MNKQEAEERLAAYLKTVEEIDRGFERGLDEYAGVFVMRDEIEDALADGLDAADEFLVSLSRADAKLRTLLRTTKRSIRGDQPERRFWWWGIPKRNAEALEDAAREAGWID